MLSVQNLVVAYGSVPVLKGVNVEVASSSIVAVIGANGAGKSTLLKVISGLVPVRSGEIRFLGRTITNMPPEEVARLGIIQCPERRRIFPEFTVEENLKIGSYRLTLGARHRQALCEKVYSYFPILRERRNQVASTLSGGEQQMLAIGRSLMGAPKLLLLDEPSLGLAPLVVKEIFRIITEIRNDGVTILLVEQNANQAIKVADQVYVFETGRVVLQGSPSEISHSADLVKAYLGR